MRIPPLIHAQTPRGQESWARRLAAAVAQSWQVEHHPDGTHKFQWVDVPYIATRFFASGTGGSWGVGVEDQLVLGYWRIADQCTFMWRLGTTDVTGAANNRLLIRLPEGFRATRRTSGWHYYDDAGTEGGGLARIALSMDTIELFKSNSSSNWTATTSDNTYTEGSVTFPIER